MAPLLGALGLRRQPALIDGAELPDPNAPIGAEFLAESPWLEDYALFEALTRVHAGAPFWRWPPAVRDREPAALSAARQALAQEVSRIEREQYAFWLQWRALRDYAHGRGVRLFGDLPFYVGPSSVETWAHREPFQLSASGEAAQVGGVPPDYFSELGQLWGNPVHDWQALRRSDFSWCWRGCACS
jgi:4-alpha-glucanotransferase